MTIEIHSRSLRGSTLVQRYLSVEQSVQPFFRGNPFDIDSYRARWQELQPKLDLEARRQVAATLRPTSAVAAERLQRFVRDGGAVVTTGQQAGLFTGPLYTVYKILTAVRLAAALEDALRITVLPVFWVASEDHDWSEVNHVHVVGQQDALARIEVSSSDPRPLPMAERLLEKDVESAVEAVAELLSGNAFAEEVLTPVRAAYRAGIPVAAAFRKVVEDLFAAFDLLTTDAADPTLKALSAPILSSELAKSAEHEALLRTYAGQLAEFGFNVQVPILAGATNVFVHTSFGRERLFRTKTAWRTRETGQIYSRAELDHLLASDPGRLSPNVLLRPVVESAVFPTLAYVAGPGEISYFAQLKGLFASHAVGMPLVYPRASFLLIPGSIQRSLRRLSLTLEDLGRPRHELIQRHSVGKLPADLVASLVGLREQVVHGFDELAGLAARIDPSLAGAIEARRNRSLAAIADSEMSVVRGVKRHEAQWAKDLDRVRNHLVPTGEDQERHLNVFSYLAESGRELFPAVARHIDFHWAPPSAVLSPVESELAPSPIR